jgi:serine/threonine protein kinase
MEQVEGWNLQDCLEQPDYQPITQDQAIFWLKQLAEILVLVHQQNYFHRDIKPSNIMLRSPQPPLIRGASQPPLLRRARGDQLVLIDFGTVREVTATYLAKVSGQQNVTGIFSAGYTPPEQFNGRAVPQSDFYALGRTFVHLLTGKHPSDLHTDTRTGKLIWRDSASQISESLADLIDNLMATFPGGRPQNAKIILQRLAQIERNLSLTVTPTVLMRGEAIAFLVKFFSPITRLKKIGWVGVTVLVLATVVITVGGQLPKFSPQSSKVEYGKPSEFGQPYLVRTLSDSVGIFSISLNEQSLASRGFDGTIKLWNLKTGEVRSTFKIDSAARSPSDYPVVISPDNQTLASGSRDGTIKLWNLETQELKSTFSGHASVVISFAISRDGQTLVSASRDGTIKLWNLKTGELRSTLKIDSSDSIAIAPDIQTLVSASGSRTIKLWNLKTGQLKNTLDLIDSANFTTPISLNAIAISSDGQTLAGRSHDGTIRLWNLLTGELKNILNERDRFRSNPEFIRTIAISPDGKTVAASLDSPTSKSIKIWRMP